MHFQNKFVYYLDNADNLILENLLWNCKSKSESTFQEVAYFLIIIKKGYSCLSGLYSIFNSLIRTDFYIWTEKLHYVNISLLKVRHTLVNHFLEIISLNEPSERTDSLELIWRSIYGREWTVQEIVFDNYFPR